LLKNQSKNSRSGEAQGTQSAVQERGQAEVLTASTAVQY
jgi:hypothetical protein